MSAWFGEDIFVSCTLVALIKEKAQSKEKYLKAAHLSLVWQKYPLHSPTCLL